MSDEEQTDQGQCRPNSLHSLQPLNPQTAREHGWQPARDFTFIQQMPALSAQVGELGALVPNVPLAFAKIGEDRYALVLITGFADGRNQLVNDQGRWLLQVLPMELQTYPFALQPGARPDAASPAQYTLCFNHGSGLYRETPDAAAGEQRFFTDDGQHQPLLKAATGQLQKLLGQQRRTQRAVDALKQHALLVPWQIQPREGHPDELLPQGLYRIDEARLNALKGEALEALHQVHALALAYGQLLSMGRIQVLQRLKDAHAARRPQHAATANPPTPGAALGLTRATS